MYKMNYCGNIVGLNTKERRICGELNKYTTNSKFNSCNKPTYPISSFQVEKQKYISSRASNVVYFSYHT